MIRVTGEMVEAFELAAWPKPDSEVVHIEAGLAAVLALVKREHIVLERDADALCPAVTETQGVLVRCGKKADDHNAHLGRHDGWDVVW